MNAHEPPRPVGTPSFMWTKYYVEHTRMEAFRVERDMIIRTFDAVPYGLQAEYLRQRQARLRKRFE